jgi:type IV pilus assembly protein PilO
MSVEELFFKVNRWQRIAILGAIGVLMVVGFYFFFIDDMLGQIKKLEQDIARTNLEIVNQKNIAKEKPKLMEQIEAQKKKLQTMVASLPERQEIEMLLKTITDLLSETHLVSRKFVPGQERVNEELYFATIPINLNVRGDYQKQGCFLWQIDKLPRIVNVPTIRLGIAGGLTGRESEMAKKLEVISLDADINGETYRRLSDEEIKAIAAKKTKAKPAQKKR